MNMGVGALQLVEDDDRAKQRKDVRVRATMPVRFTVLSARQFQAEKDLLESRASSFSSYYRWLTQQPSMGSKEHDDVGTKLLHMMFDLQGRVNRVLQIIEKQAAGEGSWLKGRTGDVSAGGLQLIVPQPLRTGDKLKLAIEIPFAHGIEVPALCEVRNVEKAGEDGADRTEPVHAAPPVEYAAGLQFAFIVEEDRDLLVRYIFQRQRDSLRRRRMGSEE